MNSSGISRIGEAQKLNLEHQHPSRRAQNNETIHSDEIRDISLIRGIGHNAINALSSIYNFVKEKKRSIIAIGSIGLMTEPALAAQIDITKPLTINQINEAKKSGQIPSTYFTLGEIGAVDLYSHAFPRSWERKDNWLSISLAPDCSHEGISGSIDATKPLTYLGHPKINIRSTLDKQATINVFISSTEPQPAPINNVNYQIRIPERIPGFIGSSEIEEVKTLSVNEGSVIEVGVDVDYDGSVSSLQVPVKMDCGYFKSVFTQAQNDFIVRSKAESDVKVATSNTVKTPVTIKKTTAKNTTTTKKKAVRISKTTKKTASKK